MLATVSYHLLLALSQVFCTLLASLGRTKYVGLGICNDSNPSAQLKDPNQSSNLGSIAIASPGHESGPFDQAAQRPIPLECLLAC